MSGGGLDQIPPLQAEIDALDAQIVELVRQRLGLSRLIGRIKREWGATPFDHGRIGARRARFLLLCDQAGLPSAMAEALFALIADQVAAERRAIFAA